ncbi:MAG: DUF4230 domain-containing protein [Chitinophagales bacterium]
MAKFLGTFLAIIIGVLIGGYFMHQMTDIDLKPKVHSEQESQVILEKIKKVFKIVVVEGEFADVFRYQDFYGWDLPGFRKTAILKVKAKVSVGYDLEQLKINFDHGNRIIYIENLPEPEIIAIDPDISYFDLEDGIFNTFDEKTLTKLNKTAKDTIRSTALQSSLIPAARSQAIEMLDMITGVARESGWKVEMGTLEIPIDDPTKEQPMEERKIPVN